MDAFKNPFDTVQLIPIFNYLNILSDFLFVERYLEEIDQNKQIPIVNALYKYLQHNKNNQVKKVELIRTLLKGSDLYGEEDGECFDATFVNAMFEYIISSLVFDKYGNIYGFLASVFLKAEKLQVKKVLNLIKAHLADASFENEYGDNSVLTILSANRIYEDIILPLFPRANTNINLLSLDYIYAQAGSMFLRPGRINTVYYSNLENTVANLTDDDDSFDELLLTGHVIERIILQKENVGMLKAFALPALAYYIFNWKYLFVYENMANVISDLHFWQTAYKHLFEYTDEIFYDLKVMLQNDNTLQMHFALSSLESKAALIKAFVESNYFYLDEKQKIGIALSLEHINFFELCKVVKCPPSVTESLGNKIDNITKIYEMLELQLVQEAFPKFLLGQLERDGVVIKLFIPNHTEEHDFPKSQYDFLEFYFPYVMRFDYYILKPKDYNVTLINKIRDRQLFKETIDSNFDNLYNKATMKILKASEENCTVFFRNLVNYKKSRLQSYLNILVNRQGNMSMSSDWWTEFGFSLVPYYPCLSDTSGKNYGNSCEVDDIKFLYKYQNEASKLVSRNTGSFLSSIGTTIRSVFLKYAGSQTVDEIVAGQKWENSITNALNTSGIFENICLHLNDPGFQLNFTTKDEIMVFEKIIHSLKHKTNLGFTSVINSLSMILILKYNFIKSVGSIGNNTKLLFVNTFYNQTVTGYGYKFIFVSDDSSRIAQLRTGYELKDKLLLLPITYSTESVKKYFILNKVNFEADNIMYQINDQLRRQLIKVSFFGISVQVDDCDEKCNDNRNLEKWKHLNICHRRRRYIEKLNYEEEAVKYIRKNKRLSEEQIRNTLGKFTFPDNATLTQFVDDWLGNNSSNETMWSSDYKINNPILLSELRYNFRFENHDVAEYDGTFRINSLYSQMERRKIEEDASIETIIKNYNEQNATFSVTFHDYYAIRNFVTTGYTRITRDTHEAKLMKIALYKLAIRQSDDPVEEFNLKLFRVECKPISFLTVRYYNEYIDLQKFTSAFSSIEAAVRFAGFAAPGFMNVVYEMVFHEPYFRAKIQQFYKEKEENVILLPGSKFLVTNGSRVDIGGLGKTLKLKLELKHNFYDDKFLWYRNIMNEIARIKF